MELLDIARGFLGAVLPPDPPIKAVKTQQSEPGHRRVIGGTTARLQQTDRAPQTTDRLAARDAANTASALRTLSYSSPDMSGAVFANLRVGIPEKYTVVGRDMDGQVNVQATQLAQELLRRMVMMGNPDGSFAFQKSVQSLSESLAKELQVYGAMAGEVSLDKARIPSQLSPIAVTTLKWYDEDKSVRPVQLVGGVEINLDIPTFVYVSLDQDLLDPYPGSIYEAAIQPMLQDIDFNNDTRRATKRAVLPRLMAVIDSDAVKKFTPPDILNDSNKFSEYKNQLINAVKGVLDGAQPEDALISFSEVEYSILDAGKDPSAIIERLQKVINSKMVTGLKTMPVILGQSTTSNASSTEALLFLKNANVIRTKLNEFYSKALTIAARIMGQDCYVEFEYDELDLRPSSELEAYKSMRQSRLLEQLSYGFITDEEASIKLTGNLPPAGFKPLSGTMFLKGAAAGAGLPAGAAQPGTAASPTSNMGSSPNATPTQPKGPSNKKAEDEIQFQAVAFEALQQANTQAVDAVKDMAYGLVKNANRAVEVSVAPQELHLTLAQEQTKPVRSIRIVRGEDGKVASMEVIQDAQEAA